MARQIASLNIDGSALQRVLNSAAAGDDPSDALAGYAAEVDPYLGDDEALGADINTLLEAVQGDEITGSDFGEDIGDDYGAEDISKGLNQLIQAATAGADEFGADFGEDDVMGARKRINRAAKRVNARRARSTAKPSKRPLANQTRRLPAGNKERPMANPFTKPFQRVLDRQNPGEGPYCPIPVNLQGGLTALLAAGASQDIPIRAPKDVVLTNFVISGEHASRFAIGPITVENDNLLGTNGAVPGDMFRPDSKVNKLPNKLARGGRDIVVRVTNISGSDSMFVAALIGDEADTDERAARGR